MDYRKIACNTVAEIETNCKCREDAVDAVVSVLKKYGDDIELRRCLESELAKEGYDISVCCIGKASDVEVRKMQNYVWEAHKSAAATERLIDFMKRYPDDAQVFFSCWHALKIKHLLELGLIEHREYYDANPNLSLKQVVFSHMFDDDLFDYLDCLPGLGIPHYTETWFRRALFGEYVLYTIELNDPSQGYKKANTVKVALSIVKPDFLQHEVDGKMKKQYSENTAKHFGECMKLIDEEVAGYYVEYCDGIDYDYEDGYEVLYKLLKINS